MIYILIYVPIKRSVAYQDVDIEHGVLASVLRANGGVQCIHMTPSNHTSTFAEGVVAYQDVDIEHGVLASVMRAKHTSMLAEGFPLWGDPFRDKHGDMILRKDGDTKALGMQNGVRSVLASSCTPIAKQSLDS